MTELTALWIGDSQSAEFCAAANLLAVYTQLTIFADTSAARDWFTAGHPSPEFIVLAQSYPGQFTTEAVKPLRAAAPLTRIIVLLGSWSEGESRSGKPVPGTIRVYWHQFETRCLPELQQLRLGRCLSWGLAATATDDERLLMLESYPTPSASDKHIAGLAAIITSSREMADCLEDACRAYGLASVWFLPGQQIRASGIAVVFWDAPTFLPEHAAALHRVKQASENAPVIALLDFPRIDDRTAALDAGASIVLSKPLQLPELLNHPFFTSHS